MSALVPTGGHAATQADILVAVVGFAGYFLCFCSYLYLWHCRYFPPVRVKNPGLTVLANAAAFMWFLSLMITDRLKSLWQPSPVTCWSWQLFGQFLGLSIYLTAILAKQYRAFQHYAVGKATYSSLAHVMLGQIPVLVLMAIPVKLYLEDSYDLLKPDLTDYISWGYEGLIAILCFIMVLNLRAANTCYHYPNYGDSSLECLGLLLQAFFHGYVLLSPAFSYQTKRLLVTFGSTVIIPIAVFFGVLGKPMWKYFTRDAEFVRSFDQHFGSRVAASGASFAAAYSSIGYRLPSRHLSRVRQDYIQDHPASSFEVEELSRLVMAGELRQVKQLLYHSTLGIINEKDSEGSTPLHRAVRNMHKEMIEFLLNMGADVDVAEADGVTALHVAASLGNVDCIFLLAGVFQANVNAVTETHGKTPLAIAVKSECMATICTLLNLGADPNRCAPGGDAVAPTDVRAYIRKVGHYSKHKSPFFLAVELGLDRIINFMHTIHRGGVAVEAPGPQGLTPLCVAALLGHTGVMESLLTMRADPFAVAARQRSSALHYACMKGSLRAFQALLKALSRALLLRAADPSPPGPTGADGSRDASFASDGDDEPPSPLAPVRSTSGLRVSFDESVGYCEVHSSAGCLTERSRTGSSDTFRGGGCLFEAADGGQRPIHCPDIPQPLHGPPGALDGRGSLGPDVLEGPLPRLPVAFFAFLDLQDRHGRTALHYAVLKGSAQITYMLLCLGADPGLRDHPPPDAGPPRPGLPSAPPRPPAAMGSPDAPTKGATAQRYAELAQRHDPYGKVVAVFEEAGRLLQHRPDYPHQYLHDDAKWLPVT